MIVYKSIAVPIFNLTDFDPVSKEALETKTKIVKAGLGEAFMEALEKRFGSMDENELEGFLKCFQEECYAMVGLNSSGNKVCGVYCRENNII